LYWPETGKRSMVFGVRHRVVLSIPRFSFLRHRNRTRLPWDGMGLRRIGGLTIV
jgi:hypothetical protein